MIGLAMPFPINQALAQEDVFPSDEGRDLVAESIEIDLTPGLAHQFGHVVHGLGVADLAAQGDHGCCHGLLPLQQDPLRLGEAFDLRRVVAYNVL